jgi:nucleoside-diphosphate kinase
VIEKTLAMIKPDAMGKNLDAEIIKRLEDEAFRIRCVKKDRLSKEEAKAFYSVHEGKPFYDALVDFMSSGPIVALLLERENAILHLREVLGATNPEEAREGTIRADFAESTQKNAVHASDSPESAGAEISFFFSKLEALRAV